jgi:hypothetical protein
MSDAAKGSSSLWAIFGILFLVFFLYVVYSANQGNLPFFIRRLYMFPGGDKVGHFIGNLFVSCQSAFAPKAFFVGTLIVLFAITAEEISQIFIANRNFTGVNLKRMRDYPIM